MDIWVEYWLSHIQIDIDTLLAPKEIENININLTTTNTKFNGMRLWFLCPICNSRISKLYRRPIDLKIGCRECLNLEYACRKYKGT